MPTGAEMELTPEDLGMHPQPDGSPTCCIGFCFEPATMRATFGDRGWAHLCSKHWQEFKISGMWGHPMTNYEEL